METPKQSLKILVVLVVLAVPVLIAGCEGYDNDIRLAIMAAIDKTLLHGRGENYEFVFLDVPEGYKEYDKSVTVFFDAQNAFGGKRRMRAGVLGKKEGGKWVILILLHPEPA